MGGTAAVAIPMYRRPLNEGVGRLGIGQGMRVPVVGALPRTQIIDGRLSVETRTQLADSVSAGAGITHRAMAGIGNGEGVLCHL